MKCPPTHNVANNFEKCYLPSLLMDNVFTVFQEQPKCFLLPELNIINTRCQVDIGKFLFSNGQK